MKRIGRRQFLKTSLSGLALATLPKISFAQSNPDVVVIGAGAAGLAATAELMKKGKSVVCIEAMGRIGGRVYTDNSIFGVPYDMGAHWLDGADIEVTTKHGMGHMFEANYEAEYEADQETWHECPPYYIEDNGMANKNAKIDASCITYGYHIGGKSWESWKFFSRPFKKKFIENLLN